MHEAYIIRQRLYESDRTQYRRTHNIDITSAYEVLVERNPCDQITVICMATRIETYSFSMET